MKETLPEEKKTLSKEEVEALLLAQTESINYHINVLEAEVYSAGDVLRRWVRHPLVKVGATLVVGVVVGRLLGGLGRSRAADPLAHRALSEIPEEAVHERLAARVALETEAAAASGHDPFLALRASLQRHAAAVAPVGGEEEGSWFGEVPRLIFRVLMGMVVREGIAKAMDMLGAEELQDLLVPEPEATLAVDVLQTEAGEALVG